MTERTQTKIGRPLPQTKIQCDLDFYEPLIDAIVARVVTKLVVTGFVPSSFRYNA